MIRLEQIRLQIDLRKRREPWEAEALLRKKAAGILRVRTDEIQKIVLVRHSIDARKKPQLFDVCTIDVALSGETEERLLRVPALREKIRRAPGMHFSMPVPGKERLPDPPVVVGAGPAGLFCALRLAEAGYRPVLLERGDDTAARDEAVRRYWEGGRPDPESNIQFGLGGAGTYSDGKLTTGVRDRQGLGEYILRTFVSMGAPQDILYESHPHIGTDGLRGVVEQMRRRIEAHGGRVLLRTKLVGVSFEKGSGRLCGVSTTAGEHAAQVLVPAIGHSARDTLAMFCEAGAVMEQKAFAVGLRVAHPQVMIDRAQYGAATDGALPPAIYRLTARAADGRGVYSFCMCPGGKIIDASSEADGLCVNGMSGRARDGRYANSAIVVTVSPDDYRISGHPMEGADFQRRLEQRAKEAGGGVMPVSFFGDYARVVTGARTDAGRTVLTDFDPKACICGGYRFADLSGILPPALNEAIVSAMPAFGRQIAGFDGTQTVLAGVESRTSSPVRMMRGADGQALMHEGVWPCGEGAGYAGGIMSAAMDGLRTADRIITRYARPKRSGA